ncbi:MAG: outer membrane lipoprotein chaperone LolA [Pseudomonadales bacterium]
MLCAIRVFVSALLVLVLLSALAPSAVAAASAAGATTALPAQPTAQQARDSLRKRLAAMDRFHAHFSQFIEGARGEVIEESTGEVLMQRPLLRWEVDQPYPQTIVADAKRLQIYDPDLAQVMVKPLSEALDDSPIALLTSDTVGLNDAFDVVLLPGEGVSAEDVYLLSPRSQESLFQEVRLHFEGAVLTALLIFDHLGQYTTVRFRQIPGSAVLESALFDLDLPEDVDIIDG